MVLGVLGEIAVRTRFLNRLNDRRPLNGLQAVQFGLQSLKAFRQHRKFLKGGHPSRSSWLTQRKRHLWAAYHDRPRRHSNLIGPATPTLSIHYEL